MSLLSRRDPKTRVRIANAIYLMSTWPRHAIASPRRGTLLPAAAVISVAAATFASASSSARSPSLEAVSQAFFGLHVLNFPERASWPTIRFGAWRLWDNGVTWPD